MHSNNIEKENQSTAKKRFNLMGLAKKAITAVTITFYRFPVTLILFAVLAGIIIYRIETPYYRLQDIELLLNRITAAVILGIPFSLSIGLIMEKYLNKVNLYARLAIYIGEGLSILLFFLYLFPNYSMISIARLLLLTSAMVLVFLSVPYMFNRKNFEVYVTRNITKAATTALFTIVLASGISATFFAIQALLIPNMEYTIYSYVWVLSWFIFAPVHFLHDLPGIEDNLGEEDYSKIIKVLILYIVLPIISIYTIVLYLYFAKVIIAREWPISIVSYLVVSYSAFGIAAVFFAAPFVSDNKWAKSFTNIYTKLIFPLLAMMFVSIGIRIGSYGVTENRYFIVIIGIWTSLAIIFLNFNKGRNNTYLPISLALVAVLAVIGPLNAFQVSKWSQNQRLEIILENYNMIENRTIVKSDSEITDYDKKEIDEILSYFAYKHSYSDVKYLPEDFIFDKFEDVFGFEPSFHYYDMPTEIYFEYLHDTPSTAEITGYDVFYRVRVYHYDIRNNILFEQEFSSSYGKFRLEIDNKNTISVFLDNAELYRENLDQRLKSLYDKYGSLERSDKSSGQIDNKDLIWVSENQHIRIMIVLNSAYGNVSDDMEEVRVNMMDIDVFVGIK